MTLFNAKYIYVKETYNFDNYRFWVTLKELKQPAPRFVGSHSMISNKPRLHTEKNTCSHNENPESLCYEQKHTSVLQRRICIFGP